MRSYRSCVHRPVPLIILAFVSVSLLFAFFLQKDLECVPLTPLLQFPGEILFALFLTLISLIVRVARWQWYLGRLKQNISFSFSVLTYLAAIAFILSPTNAGETVRASYVAEIGIPPHDVAKIHRTERIFDVTAMLALTTLLLPAKSIHDGVIWITAIGALLALASSALLQWRRPLKDRVAGVRFLPRWAVERLVRPPRRLASLQSRLHAGALIAGFLASVIAWSIEGLVLSFLAGMFAQANVGILAAIGVCALARVLGTISSLPAGLGVTDAVMVSLLLTLGCSISDTLIVVILYRFVTLCFPMGLGWLSVIALHFKSVQGTATP